ncbi:hypothetical protein [Caballeronia sp. AZ10_KS36]|uniref:hypothetical protein n=1 Tax=Caballeronia sp. AZ10_KS36 TaxID=2921757 RepID=UPI002027F8E6|nr:hypothetical protein [Caballeronia sp. AZ10_KS36]
MSRFAETAHTARRRIGQVSSTIASASRHFVPPKLNSWKLALYLVAFLLPGGSLAVLGMGWFENRHRRKGRVAEKTGGASSRALIGGPCTGGSTGR